MSKETLDDHQSVAVRRLMRSSTPFSSIEQHQSLPPIVFTTVTEQSASATTCEDTLPK